jgi:3-polyprenyl-4-hydroxybenzoate decarboxylase
VEKPDCPMKTAMPFLSEIASGSKLGIDATKKIPGEGFERPWPPLHQDGCRGEGEDGKALRRCALTSDYQAS